MAIREGVWDCPYCGATRIRGSLNECSGCGAPRDKDVRMYLPEDAAEVTDEAALARARSGADWRCAYCSRENPAGSSVCGECGASADGSEIRRGPQGAAKPAPVVVRQAAPVRKGGAARWLIVLGVIAAIAVGLWFFVFRTHAEQVTVLGHQWEREIEIEKYKTISEEKWADQVPADARELSRSRQLFETKKVQVGTKRVKTGTRDLGNGYFEDVFADQPVYEDKQVFKDKVRYQVERWRTERKVELAGKDSEPRWPDPKLVEKEREGKRSETLTLLLAKPGREPDSLPVPDETLWRFYQDGKSYRAQVRASGGIAELERPAEKL